MEFGIWIPMVFISTKIKDRVLFVITHSIFMYVNKGDFQTQDVYLFSMVFVKSLTCSMV